MQDRTEIVLRAADLSLTLAPGIGGAIMAFRQGGFALLRETPPETADVRLLSCYPLVPFSNRIAAGRFSFTGRSYSLWRDPLTGGPHAIHGEGWRRAWDVAEAGDSSARITLDHHATEPESWPFPFRAEQHFALSAAGLALTFVLTNTASVAAPAGIGLHPYFPRHAGVVLGFQAKSVWRNGEDHLPSQATPLPEEWNFSSPRPLGEPGLDNCFASWSGRAEIAWPAAGRGLSLMADRCFGHAVVYTPPRAADFAFEPVSHMNDAINRLDQPDNGLVVLEPGASLRGTVHFLVSASSPPRR